METKILYVGYLLNEDMYLSNSATHVSGGIFEEGLLYEMKKQAGVNNLSIISIVPNNYYPHGPLFFKKNIGITKRGLEYTALSYINLPLLKQQTIFRQLKKAVKKWIKESGTVKKVIVFYNLGTPFVQVLYRFMKKVDGIYPIVCDFFHRQKKEKKLTAFFHDITEKAQEKYINKFSGLIILNRCLADDYNVRSFLVMEGAVSESMVKQTSFKVSHGGLLSVRYAGALDELHGTKVLIRLGHLLKKRFQNIELLIAGRGNMLDDVISASDKEDTCLKYVGSLNRDDANNFIVNSDILIIPHQESFFQLRYQFSSKMFDYMAAKRIVIITPMPGFPDEYKDLVFVASGSSEDDLAEAIEKIIESKKDELDIIAEKAREFVLLNRTWKIQAKRLLDYVTK